MTASIAPLSVGATLLLAVILTWLGTWLVRCYALNRDLLDYPGARSSHSRPTPRGGGLAIAVVLLAAVALQTLTGWLSGAVGVALLAGGLLIALVGWVDDHRSLPAKWRGAVHFLAAAWVVGYVGAPESISVGSSTFPLGSAAPAVAVVALVWFTNLFNFMDGIDGVAAVQATWVGAVAGMMLLATGATGLAMTSLVLSGSSLGFLAWNWPPARIFMGDVGSGMLGFMLGAIALAAWATTAVQPVVWLMLMGVFVFDATVTLIRRIGRERLYEAHNRHGYQRAVQAGMSHRDVTLAVLALNVILGVLASVAWAVPAYTLLALLLSVFILVTAYLAVERRRPMWRDVVDEREGTRENSSASNTGQ